MLYDMYNPCVQKIEVMRLERRLDADLSYLIDALPEYSTFDVNMEPIFHLAGTPVPVNDLKVCVEGYFGWCIIGLISR